MAWASITGTSRYEYNNAPADPGATSQLRSQWLKQTNGVRTSNTGKEVYTNIREAGGSGDDIGELSKSYYDNQ